MTILKQRYAQLLSWTQLFLLREYSVAIVKSVDPAVANFFLTRKKLGSPLSPAKKIVQQPLASAPSTQFNKIPVRATTTPPSPDPRPPEIHPNPTPAQPFPPTTPPEPPSPDPKPPVIHDKLSNSKHASKMFALDPMGDTPVSHLNREFWKLFSTLFPDVNLSESIPSDAQAQKIKNNWLQEQMIPPVVLLSFQEGEKQLIFLKNIADAISLQLAPARVFSASKIEQENEWDALLKSPALQLVIASDYGLYMQPGLMKFYREIPQQGKHFLGSIPLLLLSDLSLYLKEPQLKSLLWRAICNEFAAARSLSS